MKLSNKFSISNGTDIYVVENVGQNSGCPFCGNERCDLFYIWSDDLGDFSDVCGDNYICRKCLPDVFEKYGFKKALTSF